MRAIIPVEDNALEAVRGFLKQLLEVGAVDALLTPVETTARAITHALVTDPDRLDTANPLAPVMGLNAAHLAGRVSVREPRGRIGVVLRACELRALMELVKLQQASLDDLVTVGVDCLGTYDVPSYTAIESNGRVDMTSFFATAQSGKLTHRKESRLRDACQMCERPYVEEANIMLELFGADLTVGIPVTLPDDLCEMLRLNPADLDSVRPAVIEKVVAARTKVRDAALAEMRRRLDQEGIEGVFAACVRCHNCMVVCPICYCKTCLFKSPSFDHEPDQYMNWAQRKGACRLPADTMLFHLTRLNHMALSCVGCGMCTSGCPAELPVGLVFRTIGQQVQAEFDYVPGRDVEEPLPLVTFSEEEWLEAGKK